jgi:hypothetical protein
MRNKEHHYKANDWAWVLFFVMLAVAIIEANAQKVSILYKPDTYKVYKNDYEMICIEAAEEIALIELYDEDKRRLKYQPKQDHIIINTNRLKAGYYTIIVTIGAAVSVIKIEKHDE